MRPLVPVASTFLVLTAGLLAQAQAPMPMAPTAPVTSVAPTLPPFPGPSSGPGCATPIPGAPGLPTAPGMAPSPSFAPSPAFAATPGAAAAESGLAPRGGETNVAAAKPFIGDFFGYTFQSTQTTAVGTTVIVGGVPVPATTTSIFTGAQAA